MGRPAGRDADGYADACSSWAMRRMSRDLRFAAWFLWMTPLAAALSIRFTARRRASARSSVPASAAVGAHRLVAQAAPLVLSVPLDLAADVGHVSPSGSGSARPARWSGAPPGRDPA